MNDDTTEENGADPSSFEDFADGDEPIGSERRGLDNAAAIASGDACAGCMLYLSLCECNAATCAGCGRMVKLDPTENNAGVIRCVPCHAARTGEEIPEEPRDTLPMNPATETPWNWCPKCETTVDDDMRTGEFRDGSEGTCIGCGTVYVAVAYTDESWALHEAGESSDEENES